MQVKADQIVQQERLLEAENRSQRLEEKCDRLLMKLVASEKKRAREPETMATDAAAPQVPENVAKRHSPPDSIGLGVVTSHLANSVRKKLQFPLKSHGFRYKF